MGFLWLMQRIMSKVPFAPKKVRKNLNEIGTVFVAVAQIIAGIVCA
jgi:hypothetical protein